MAEKKESNEDILRAILEKGGARFKEQVAQELARQETAPVEKSTPVEPAKTRKKSLKDVAGSFGKTKYYYAPDGTVVDSEGAPAPETFAKLFGERKAMAQKIKKAIVPKSFREIEGEINKTMTRTNRLIVVDNMVYLKSPVVFTALHNTIQNLTNEHDKIVRNFISQNDEMQEKVIEVLTGKKSATRSAGAVGPTRTAKTLSKSVGASKLSKLDNLKTPYRKARFSRPADVKARQERMKSAREKKEKRQIRAASIIGGGIGLAASIVKQMVTRNTPTDPSAPTSAPTSGSTSSGGASPATPTSPTTPSTTAPPSSTAPQDQGQTPGRAPGGSTSPPGTPSSTAGMVKLTTPSGTPYEVAAPYAQNFKGFVDELESSGYKIKRGGIGGYSNRPGWHGKGMAIDINPDQNPMLIRTPDGRIVNKITGQESSNLKNNKYPFGYGTDNFGALDVSAMAKKHGLGWGGNWKSSVDTMHFSAGPNEGGTGVGAPTSAAPQTASASPGVPAPQTGAGNIPAVGTPSGGAVNPGNISAPGAGAPTGFAPATGGNASWQTDKPFMDEVNRVAQKFNIKADDLLAVMASESGVKANAVNPKGGATGLIQFMPRTATALGTTTAALQQMSRAEQMTYVDKFLTMNNLPSGASAGRIYATIFLPGRASKDVLTERGEIYYESNRALDMNGDGKITISDLDARIAQKAAAFGIGSTTTAQQGAPQVAAAPAQNPGNIAAPGVTPPSGTAPGVTPPSGTAPGVTPPSGTAPGEPQRATGGDFPGGDIVAAGKWLQGQGIRVSENPSFGGVNPVHRGRGHYEGRAIDVNAGVGIVEANDPVWGPRFDDIAAKAKAAGYTVIWRSAGHYNHMHIEIPAGGAAPTADAQVAASTPGAPAAAPAPTQANANLSITPSASTAQAPIAAPVMSFAAIATGGQQQNPMTAILNNILQAAFAIPPMLQTPQQQPTQGCPCVVSPPPAQNDNTRTAAAPQTPSPTASQTPFPNPLSAVPPTMTPVPQKPLQGKQFNENSRTAENKQTAAEQEPVILPIINNNTQTVNNTRTISRGQISVTRSTDGFNPLDSVAQLAGFAIGKGLRGLF
jgi:hypothetical protein